MKTAEQMPTTLFRRTFLIVGTIFAALLVSGFEQPAVTVEPTGPLTPRIPENQTQAAVIGDYLKAWQSLSVAFEKNRTDLLDAHFVGVAKDKLADTIRHQQQLGIQTRYQDRAHNLRLVFYSPEGLSIQLLDRVEYDVQIQDHEKMQANQNVHARYLVVLTPAEARWKVRIFQAEPND